MVTKVSIGLLFPREIAPHHDQASDSGIHPVPAVSGNYLVGVRFKGAGFELLLYR